MVKRKINRFVAAWRCLMGRPTAYRLLLSTTFGIGPQKDLKFIECFNEYG